MIELKVRGWQDWSDIGDGLRFSIFNIYDKGDLIVLANEEFIALDTYTGRQDNNKKDIYAGDILKRKDSTPYIVEYNEEYAVFMAQQHYKRDKKFWIYLHALGTDCEVIGNIYETPELLNDE